ncbi:MAG: LysE family translocator [Alphaproteobacteria bacterium]|jgi:threonine/homoserine/homoserine lactone efflux protein|nr:LysE family translocator [Alphaproteobacteria bacterium]
MTLAGLLVFAAAYALAVASPGPGIAAVVGQVLGRGIRTAPSLIAGILTGDLIWFTCAALGLAALAQAYAGIFLAIKWVGVAYLVFLAWKMWTSPVDALQASADRKDISHGQLFISGLSLTLGNPKAIAFFMALLPAIVDLAQLSVAGFAEVALLIAIILPTVLLGYALFAHAARGVFRSPRAMKTLNRVSGTAIAGAAAAIAVRN